MYRDSFESCPRCRTALGDAGAVRACEQCGGQWIGEAVLSEMVLEMLLPAVLRKVEIGTVDTTTGESIACPSCGEKMLAFTMLRVRFERCAKGHGVWFDCDELAAVLRIVGEGAAPAGSPEPEAFLTPPRPQQQPPPPAPRKRELVFQIETPGDVVREARSAESIIKIGRLRSNHVHVPNDDRVTRLHALIDLDGPPTLVDLGSTDGTLVNGARISKHRLQSGDQFVIGATTVTVTF